MAGEPDNVVLVMLRKIDQRTERMAEDLQDFEGARHRRRRGIGRREPET